LIAFDERARLRRLPANGTASPIDIYDFGVVFTIDNDIAERKITLDKAGLVNLG
jgi:hypothetical protein